MPFSVKFDPILIVDIGNTNIVCAKFEKGQPQELHRIQTDPACSVDDYHKIFLSALPEYCNINYVAIGSVVPRVEELVSAMFAEYSRAQVFHITGVSPIGLKYLIKNPSVVGADLVANAFAAWKLYQKSTLVVDLGTATTIQLITDDGLYAGVVIIPGMKTSAANLFEHAALLSEVELRAPHCLIGNNTEDALLSGIVRGHALMIKAFVDQIEQQYSEYAPYSVILTGGLASVIQGILPDSYIIDKELTLKGLYLAAQSILEQAQE